jgi:hypothetical protein
VENKGTNKKEKDIDTERGIGEINLAEVLKSLESDLEVHVTSAATTAQEGVNK